MPEDDPDILQTLDEQDKDWIKLWKKKINEVAEANKITFIVQSQDKESIGKKSSSKKTGEKSLLP